MKTKHWILEMSDTVYHATPSEPYKNRWQGNID